MSVIARVTRERIDPADVLGRVGSSEDGAALLFLGTVRNHADGVAVRGLTYEAYVSMAEAELARIAGEAAARARTDRLVVVHRVGDLAIGDVAVAIAVSTPHRAESFDAARYVIEEIKKRLPIWKREHVVGAGSRWVEGAVPPVPEAAGE